MIALLMIAGAFIAQDMTQAEMIEEAGEIGRASFAMGACSRFGYAVHRDTLDSWTADFSQRAHAAGWDENVVASASRSGSAEEEALLDMRSPPDDFSTGQLREFATETVGRIKARCRQLAIDHAGLISGLEAGDRNADAQLAIMLRPLDQ